MKRYKGHHIRPDMVEDPGGEWVKWDDVMARCVGFAKTIKDQPRFDCEVSIDGVERYPEMQEVSDGEWIDREKLLKDIGLWDKE
ncbi:unnamed protein product [marine sediment metagenome]|uniref:Uncharacterized protein n=1 Tax=marine sediment metagenome TaxID=412755 RepID=X1BS34_9ZZZZ